MKLTFKEKAKLFWERNKVDILGWLIGAGVITGVGCVAAHMIQKAGEKYEAELAEEIQKRNEEVKKEEEAAIAAEEQIASNPENQLTDGGYVAPDRNNLNEADYPNILANSVPLTSMGQFGQDIIDLYKKEWPNWEEVGMFNPETAVTDIYLDFGHEKWLEAQRAKEDESQEKQSA